MTRSMQCPSIMIIYQNCYCGSAIIAMQSWDVVDGTPLQWRLAEGGLSLLVYIIECSFVCLFVRGKRQKYGTDWPQMLSNYKERHGKCPLLIEIARLNVLGDISLYFRFFLRGRPPFLGRRRRPYIVFRNRFWYGFMFVYIYICIYLSRWRRRGVRWLY